MYDLFVTGARADITPALPCELAGYQMARQASSHSDVNLPLEANAILIETELQKALLISFDLLFVGPAICDFVKKITKPYLEDHQIFLFASHTHYAPATDHKKQQLGKVSDAYLNWSKKQISSLIDKLLSQRKSRCGVSVRKGRSQAGVNRRRYRWRLYKGGFRGDGPFMQPNRLGYRDEELLIWEFVDLKNKLPIADLWNLGCHPVGLKDANIVSSHFPGFVRRSIRSSKRKYLPVLFFQGFSGNVRPNVLKKSANVRNPFWQLLRGREFDTLSQDVFNRWGQQICRSYRDAKQIGWIDQSVLGIHQDQINLQSLLQGESVGELKLRCLSLTKEHGFIGVTAEVFAEYCKYVPSNFMRAGCLGDVLGYLPTDRAITQGGYECKQSMNLFGLEGTWNKSIEKQIRDAFSKLFCHAEAMPI